MGLFIWVVYLGFMTHVVSLPLHFCDQEINCGGRMTFWLRSARWERRTDKTWRFSVSKPQEWFRSDFTIKMTKKVTWTHLLSGGSVVMGLLFHKWCLYFWGEAQWGCSWRLVVAEHLTNTHGLGFVFNPSPICVRMKSKGFMAVYLIMRLITNLSPDRIEDDPCYFQPFKKKK